MNEDWQLLKDYKEVATALGIGEEAAKKRVSRALEKLRGFFARRGFPVSVAALALLLPANAANAAPAGLALSITSAVLAGGSAAAGLMPALARQTLIAWRWTKAAFAAAGVLAGVGVAVGLWFSETQCLDTGFYFNGKGKLWIDMDSLRYKIIDDGDVTPTK